MASPGLPEHITAGVTTGHVTDHEKIHDLLNEFDSAAQAQATGDLLVFQDGLIKRLPVGSDGQVLTADSTQGAGVAWKTPSGGGGGGGAAWVTDWSYRSSNRSSSAFAWKGNEFTPYVDVELAAIAYFGGLVANATYQAAVVTRTGTPGNVDTIIKSRTLTLPGTLPNPDGGWLWLDFDPPVVLQAGITYGLLTGRTDGADTYALPVPLNSSGTHQQVPMPGSGHQRSWRIAKANPQVGDPIDDQTSNVVGAGYLFRLL